MVNDSDYWMAMATVGNVLTCVNNSLDSKHDVGSATVHLHDSCNSAYVKEKREIGRKKSSLKFGSCTVLPKTPLMRDIRSPAVTGCHNSDSQGCDVPVKHQRPAWRARYCYPTANR